MNTNFLLQYGRSALAGTLRVRRAVGLVQSASRCWPPLILLLAMALALLWAPAVARAQAPVLTDHDPVTNSVTAPLDSSIVLQHRHRLCRAAGYVLFRPALPTYDARRTGTVD